MGIHNGKDLSKKLFPLLPEQRALIPPEHLWLFRVEGKVFGPYTLKNLQAYLLAHSHYPDTTRVQNERDKKWISPHDSELFNRRRHDLAAQTGRPAQDENPLYLLVEGQKIGPLTLTEIQHKLQEKQILLTDYWAISTRGPWNKIFEHPQFDRRKIRLLPPIPAEKHEGPGEEEAIEHEGQSPYQEISPLIDTLILSHSKKTLAQSSAKNISSGFGLSLFKSQVKMYRLGLIGGMILFFATTVGGIYNLFFLPANVPEISKEARPHRKEDAPQNRRPADTRARPNANRAANNPSMPPQPQQEFSSSPPPPPPSYDPPPPVDDGGYQQEDPPPPEETFVEPPPAEEDSNREIASEEPAAVQEVAQGSEEAPPAEVPMEETSSNEDIIE